jgi:hypothetical protein
VGRPLVVEMEALEKVGVGRETPPTLADKRVTQEVGLLWGQAK